jgi:hypothetical protein
VAKSLLLPDLTAMPEADALALRLTV